MSEIRNRVGLKTLAIAQSTISHPHSLPCFGLLRPVHFEPPEFSTTSVLDFEILYYNRTWDRKMAGQNAISLMPGPYWSLSGILSLFSDSEIMRANIRCSARFQYVLRLTCDFCRT